MKTATFFHAGCPASQPVAQELALAIDPGTYRVEIVHLLQEPSRLAEAQRAGVRSVPALLLEGRVYHINFGMWLEDLIEPPEEPPG